MSVEPCPICGTQVVLPLQGASEIGHEFDVQREFVLSRLHSNPAPEELKDLTDFMHDSASPLAQCATCGLLRRAEARPENVNSYEEDPNDPDVMAHVYSRYVQAFRNKEGAYREFLSPNADVVEIGPHLGGFLQTAEEWNWRPVGIDVGADTTDFITRKGLKVIRGTLEDCKLRAGTFEAAFIWNCFEQLPEPEQTLMDVRGLLKDNGYLVVRVPNSLFYRAFQNRQGFAAKALAYNNLLGFPYLYGHSLATLNRMVTGVGFCFVRGFNSELVTTPFADVSADVEREQENVSRTVAKWSTQTSRKLLTLTGPWIEAVYRKTEDTAPCNTTQTIDLRFLRRAVT